MEAAKAVLCDMYETAAMYRSPGLEKAIQAMTSGPTPLVVKLGTGEGKGLIHMTQQRLPGIRGTVLVATLVGLKQYTIFRCINAGDCRVWDHGMPVRMGCEWVLVSRDEAVSENFQNALGGFKLRSLYEFYYLR
jgi:hypothetical protein